MTNEHSELEENLYPVFLALSKGTTTSKETSGECATSRGLERLLGPQVKAFWLHGEERRTSSGRDIDLNCDGLSAKMTRGVGAPELVA